MPEVKEVLWGQDNPIENAPKLTPEEEDTLKKRMLAMDKLLSDKGLAKYKLEVLFERKRSGTQPTFGLLSFWESGSKLHGGGDTKMYICAGKSQKKNDCEAFIPDAGTGYGFLVCPKCKEVWKGEQVTGELGFRLTMQNWATVLVRYFQKLEGNADVYLKYPKEDIRQVAILEQTKQLHGEQLQKVRTGIQKAIYPLAHIIRDTAGGADLEKRFYAFLKA